MNTALSTPVKGWFQEQFARLPSRIKPVMVTGDSLAKIGFNYGDLAMVDFSVKRFIADGIYVFQFQDVYIFRELRANVVTQEVEVVSYEPTGVDVRSVPRHLTNTLDIIGCVSRWLSMREC